MKSLRLKWLTYWTDWFKDNSKPRLKCTNLSEQFKKMKNQRMEHSMDFQNCSSVIETFLFHE